MDSDSIQGELVLEGFYGMNPHTVQYEFHNPAQPLCTTQHLVDMEHLVLQSLHV